MLHNKEIFSHAHAEYMYKYIYILYVIFVERVANINSHQIFAQFIGDNAFKIDSIFTEINIFI